MRSILVIAVVLMLAACTAFAQTDQQTRAEGKDQQKSYLYQWVDDKGIAHVTDNLGRVPKKYRGKAVMLEQTPGEKEPAQGQPRVTAPPRPAEENANEEYAKAEWQQRMKDARQRLADAQRRYQELEQKRNELLVRWAGGASGNTEVKLEADRIEQDILRVQQEIKDARDQIENVIPEEARKAGVPPGWLRE